MITNRGKVKAITSGLLAAIFVLAVSSVSHAGPLGVTTVDPYPDINVGFLTVTYNATSYAFAANGWALNLTTVEGVKTTITTNFSLSATIYNDGSYGGGSLTIGPAANPLLKSVVLKDFKADPVKGGALEFLFANPTGTYTTGPNPIYSPNMPVDVLMLPGTGFLGNFTANWSSSGGTADARSVQDPQGTPEPSAFLLTLVAAAGMFYYRRRAAAVPSMAHC